MDVQAGVKVGLDLTDDLGDLVRSGSFSPGSLPGSLPVLRFPLRLDQVFGAGYLRKRIQFLDYCQYRSNHLPIGSGVTEAACKTVFTQRLKQSGMTWKLEGGQRIVDLRVIRLSGVWPEVYQAYLQAKTLPDMGTQRGTGKNKSKMAA